METGAGDPKPDESTATTTTTTPPVDNPNPQTSSSAAPSGDDQPGEEKQKQKQSAESDDESDFDELDEVLDDFSKPKPSETKPSPPATQSTDNNKNSSNNNNNNNNDDSTQDVDEEAFMKQLEQDMANMMGHAAKESGTSDNAGFEAAIDQGADAFTKQLEESGIPPGDFLKQLLADVMAEEGGEKPPGGANAQASASAAAAAAAAAATGGSGGGGENNAAPESFNDAIQRTINRMKESGDKATAAATEDDTDDLLAQLLKAVESGAAGAGDDGDLSKMFMGMMEQLSNKEMLYEPMKELDTKFGPWIEQNKGKGKVSDEEMERYETQAKIVREIVTKFEEPGYTDKDSKCRDYVWGKMQEMQAAGNPPDELISNPLMDDLKGPGGNGPAMPDCPQQ